MDTLGRYKIIEQLGEGGMATVYLAHDPRFNRKVAIKVSPDREFKKFDYRTRFEREAQTIASLEHRAIVPVYDFGEQDNQLYLVMRYMPGGSLADRLSSGRIPLKETLNIIARISSALEEAHSKGVIHRDLKPGNVLFDHHGYAFLSDFGIVKVSNATTLTTEMIIGTPAYMSPEQAEGNTIDKRSDVYSLGIMLFEMLTGELPYKADTPMGVVIKKITSPIPNILEHNSDLPSELVNLVENAIATQPEKRISSASLLASELSAIVLNNKKDIFPAPTTQVSKENKVAESTKETVPISFDYKSIPLAVKGFALLLFIGILGVIFMNRLNNSAVTSNDPTPTVSQTSDTPLLSSLNLTPTSTVMATPTNTHTATPTQTVSPTNSPTATQTPITTTDTPSLEPMETAELVLAPSETPCPTATFAIIVSSVNVRAGPGTNYAIEYPVLVEGDFGTIIGVNNSGSWYNFEIEDRVGWVHESALGISEDLCAPIELAATIPASPVPTSTPIPPTNTPEPATDSGDSGTSPNPNPNSGPAPTPTRAGP